MQSLYRFYDDNKQLLYVGISSNFQARYAQHSKTSPWHHLATYSTITHFVDRESVLAAEKEAIKLEKPLFNKQHNNTNTVAKAHYYQILKNELSDDFHLKLYNGYRQFQQLAKDFPSRVESHMVNGWAIRGSMRALDIYGNAGDDELALDCDLCETLNQAEFFNNDNVLFWFNLGKAIKNNGKRGNK